MATRYSVKEIAAIIGADAAGLSRPDAPVSYLLTDSRLLTFPEETLFFAIRTATGDGRRYIADLYKSGVRNFVVQSLAGLPAALADANFLLVPDSQAALHALATFHRRRFDIPVIAITGSRGKTSVKEWLYQLLKKDYTIVRSPRNVNPMVSVPLSMWEIDESTTMAIIEAGITRPGEMAELQTTIRPTIGIFTNLGSLHREGFATKQLKAQEKASLLTACECIVYNQDDKIISETVEPILEVAQDMAWSRENPEATLLITGIERAESRAQIGYSYMGVPGEATIPFSTEPEIDNAITCLAVMLYLGIDPATIEARMAALTKVATRLDVMEGVNNCMLIADTRTSDFNSLLPSVNLLSRRRQNSTSATVILSDIEHEALSDEEIYTFVAELLERKNVTRLIGIGKRMTFFEHKFGFDAQFFGTTDDFLATMSQSDFENETILVKGATQYNFDRIIDMLNAKHNQTVLEVNLDAVLHNYNYFRSLLPAGCKMVCMVKAQAYGAGIYELAKTLQDTDAAYLAVAVHDEGVELRDAGITMPIMVLNPRIVNYKSMFSHRLEPEVYSIGVCREIIREAEKFGITGYPVHIKIDSGMHRLGMLKEDMPELVELLRSQNAISPASVFTHLCAAEDPGEDEYTMAQLDYFDQCCATLQRGFSHRILRHAFNSAAISRFAHLHTGFDLARLGIGLYGVAPTAQDEGKLQPVSTFSTVIIAINEWPEGTSIGYNRRGVLKRPSRIATIPVGYADGINWHLGNGNASVWINGSLCPTVGSICMDLSMVDVTDAKCSVGDPVEIFGTHVRVTSIASQLDTIAYEVLTSVSGRVKRVYFRQ